MILWARSLPRAPLESAQLNSGQSQPQINQTRTRPGSTLTRNDDLGLCEPVNLVVELLYALIGRVQLSLNLSPKLNRASLPRRKAREQVGSSLGHCLLRAQLVLELFQLG